MRRRDFITGGVLVLFPSLAGASTWADVEVTCPVCGTLNVFKAPASYGTYVFRDPSRLQYVFWPATTPYFLYTCRRCHLTAYMQDFGEIPDTKVSELATMLEREGGIEGEVVPYYEIPIGTRFGIARRVYEILGRDETFWCELERIAGYHFAEAGDPARAHEARGRALSLAEGLLEEGEEATRKETLVIVGSMRFFTGDVGGAREAFGEAETLTFTGPDRDAPALDEYLNRLIVDFRSELLGGAASR